jgi:hypothetical protein
VTWSSWASNTSGKNMQDVVADVAMSVEPISEAVAVLAIGSEVGDGDGARNIGEITLDALRRQAAGAIGVHHDRDVTVLEPGVPAAVPRLVASNDESRHPAGARGDHVGRALGCPAAICRSRSSLRVHNGPSGDAEATSEMVLRAGSTERGSRACGLL